MAALFGIAVMWLRGKKKRASWDARTTYRHEPYLGKGVPAKTYFVLTGAFNGPEHTEQQVEELRLEGDVYVFDWAKYRFDFEQTAEILWSVVRTVKGRKILVGWSLGGLAVFRMLYLAYADDAETAKKLELIVGDSPLCAQHLLLPDGKGTKVPPLVMKHARLVRFVRPGPIANRLLSRVIAKNSFHEVVRGPGANQELLGRHMARLHRNKLSRMVDQIVAIIMQPDHPVMGWKNKTTYVKCQDDVVIDAELTLADWKRHFPHLTVHKVKGAPHIAVPEWPEAYREVLAAAV
ncbi:alpha/beta hydrolase [Streptomyces caniscabiei]|uniref:alpha/beta fold hydrolase n=1 Tax=Streptomyces caniscabiei TaxID=2746961 RepID=UPI0029B6F47B|nr:alpha/beta hydrolase [Streptomyces caniscabiei]MDX2775898.1 alpha/beta hydrolase [Streptomyces caniscabiei]